MKEKVRFELQMTAAAKQHLDRLAEQSGHTRSAVVRRLIEGAAIREMPPADYFLMIEELRRIGVNLNQIAAAANSTGHIDAAAYAVAVTDLRRAVLEIKRAVELR